VKLKKTTLRCGKIGKNLMELAEYRKGVYRFIAPLETEQLNVLHMILGMNSEFNEVFEATDTINLSEEFCDINWYVCNYCNFINFEVENEFHFSEFYHFGINVDNNYIFKLQSEISKLTDLEKKALAYKKNIPIEEKKTQVLRIFWALNDCYVYYSIDPKVAMQRNIDKLDARYKTGKFSATEALNRDLTVERQKLEGK
jgi:NTP pyrophosphatase (non-canonical NTP hydrolase)